MDKQRILREAQKIATNFSFWMVSGDIAHLYGYVYETPDKKYELEIKFNEDFPNSPPEFIYHSVIKNLLGDFQLNKLKIWTPESDVVDTINELKFKIQQTLRELHKIEDQEFIPTKHEVKTEIYEKEKPIQISEEKIEQSDSEEYITPDLDAYPPDFEYKSDETQISSDNLFYTDPTDQISSANETDQTKNIEIVPKKKFYDCCIGSLYRRKYKFAKNGNIKQSKFTQIKEDKS